MLGKKKDEAPKGVTRDRMDQYKKERRGLEVDLLDEVLKSRVVAWVLGATGVIVGVVCLGIAAFVIHRYSQPIPPYLLTLNKQTGAVQQISIMKNQKDSYGERIDSYWVSQFVTHYESYDFYSIQSDYEAVGLMATPKVARPYLEQFAGENPKDDRLGDTRTKRVHVSSVMVDTEDHIATVRFTTQIKYRQRPLPEPKEYWIATIAYKYVNFPMTAEQRRINPLGFRVTSYRVQPVSVADGSN